MTRWADLSVSSYVPLVKEPKVMSFTSDTAPVAALKTVPALVTARLTDFPAKSSAPSLMFNCANGLVRVIVPSRLPVRVKLLEP